MFPLVVCLDIVPTPAQTIVGDVRIVDSHAAWSAADLSQMYTNFSRANMSTYTVYGYTGLTYRGIDTNVALDAFPTVFKPAAISASTAQKNYLDSISAPGDHTKLDGIDVTLLTAYTVGAQQHGQKLITELTTRVTALEEAPAGLELDESGSLALTTAGGTLKVKQGGSAACMGTGATLTLGTVTITTSCAVVGATVFVVRSTTGGANLGNIAAVAAAGSFTLTSSSILDGGTYSWLIVKPS